MNRSSAGAPNAFVATDRNGAKLPSLCIGKKKDPRQAIEESLSSIGIEKCQIIDTPVDDTFLVLIQRGEPRRAKTTFHLKKLTEALRLIPEADCILLVDDIVMSRIEAVLGVLRTLELRKPAPASRRKQKKVAA